MKSENLPSPEIARRRMDPKILVLMGILSITVLIWLFQSGTSSVSMSSRARSLSQKKSINKTDTSNEPAPFRAMLEQKPPEFQSEKRNIFDFNKPAPPPAPPQQAAEQEVAEAEPTPVCGNQICEANEDYQNCPSDCQPPPPPDIPLRYIGYLNEKEGAVVFLTDGKEIYMGRENDIIANRYRIQKITDQNVELGYLNLNQSRSIPFQGNSDN